MAYSLTALIKTIFFMILCIAFISFVTNVHIVANTNSNTISSGDVAKLNEEDKIEHGGYVDLFYRNRSEWPTSTLGGILFKREEIPQPNPNANRTFVVLVWKYWDWLKMRHVDNYGNARRNNTHYLDDCSVKNCIFTGNDTLLSTADAVLVNLWKGLFPEVKNRNLKQRWIFATDESPINTFFQAQNIISLKSFYNVFNWSMTYRSDADVPVPYGRTLPLNGPIMSNPRITEITKLVPNWDRKSRDTPATVLMSNCRVKSRNNFLKELRQYINVDVYGACSDKEEYKNSCPGAFTADCDTVAKYLFYLVLENTSCFQYLTEKLFYQAYSKGAVPVIYGPSIHDVESLLPPNSYIYVAKDANIQEVAKTMQTLADNDELLLAMHMWRNYYKVVNEHGFFGSKSYHFCRLCEALNYNDEKEKIYDKENIDRFLDTSLTCNKQ